MARRVLGRQPNHSTTVPVRKLLESGDPWNFISIAFRLTISVSKYMVKLALETVEEWCHGNKSETARGLSISRGYLHSLLCRGKVEAA